MKDNTALFIVGLIVLLISALLGYVLGENIVLKNTTNTGSTIIESTDTGSIEVMTGALQI